MDSNVTYFSEFKTPKDITSPVMSNDAMMQYKGELTPFWSQESVDFDSPSYGLRKTKEGRGLIYCNDASKLFSLERGEVDLVFTLNQNINSGVLDELNGTNSYVSDLLIWGVNIGQYGGVLPSISVLFTKDGIRFTIWTSASKFSILDTVTTVVAGQKISLKCVWDKNVLDDFDLYHGITMYYQCNDTAIISNIPINNDSISGLNFCLGNTPFLNSNLEMTVGKLVTYDRISTEFEQAWFSSSSSSSDSSLSTSSNSSSTSSFSSSSTSSHSSSSPSSDSSRSSDSSSTSSRSSESSGGESASSLSSNSSSTSSRSDTDSSDSSHSSSSESRSESSPSSRSSPSSKSTQSSPSSISSKSTDSSSSDFAYDSFGSFHIAADANETGHASPYLYYTNIDGTKFEYSKSQVFGTRYGNGNSGGGFASWRYVKTIQSAEEAFFGSTAHVLIGKYRDPTTMIIGIKDDGTKSYNRNVRFYFTPETGRSVRAHRITLFNTNPNGWPTQSPIVSGQYGETVNINYYTNTTFGVGYFWGAIIEWVLQ